MTKPQRLNLILAKKRSVILWLHCNFITDRLDSRFDFHCFNSAVVRHCFFEADNVGLFLNNVFAGE